MSDYSPTPEIPCFVLESFGPPESDDYESILLDENGCVLLPSGKPVTRVPPEEEQQPVEPEEPQPPERESEEDLQERIAALEREAYEKGYAQGQKDGLALEEAHRKEKAQHLDALFQALSRLKEQIYKETEPEIVRLSLAIAKKIVRSELQAGSYRIGDTIRAAMKLLVDPSHVRIRIGPEDMEDVSKLIPSLSAEAKTGRIQILEDQAVQRGGCILQTGFGSVNATIEDQMGVVEREIEGLLNSGGKSP